MTNPKPRPRCVCCFWPLLISATQTILILLKLIGAVAWPWLAVVAPLLLFFGLALAIWLIDVIWFRPIARRRR